MIQTAGLITAIALGSLLMSACLSTPSLVSRSELTASQPIAQNSPRMTQTPSGIFISTPKSLTATPRAARTAPPVSSSVLVLGRVFDAGSGERLMNATIEWQFLALEQQPYNGQLQVTAEGLYRLALPIRPSDEVIIFARAPGYVSSLTRLQGSQLNPYGSRLNFGLVADQGLAPTLPGALGTIQLRGIVYNVARGPQNPIAQARLTIVNRSLVEPITQLEVTTSPTGTFFITLPLHTTDQLEITIVAGGYQTGTLTRNARDLAKYPQLTIGLRPVPKQ